MNTNWQLIHTKSNYGYKTDLLIDCYNTKQEAEQALKKYISDENNKYHIKEAQVVRIRG